MVISTIWLPCPGPARSVTVKFQCGIFGASGNETLIGSWTGSELDMAIFDHTSDC